MLVGLIKYLDSFCIIKLGIYNYKQPQIFFFKKKTVFKELDG